MSLKDTNLVIEAAPLPAQFEGTPQALFEAMLARMKIKSPAGINFIQIGDTEPSSNQGPWLKNGTKWYVWSDEEKKYVPLDISDSISAPFVVSESQPSTGEIPLWLQTVNGVPVAWRYYVNGEWLYFAQVIPSGPTSSRPSNPVEYQRYYDTDINVEIWWERGAWRTVAGSPGDVKFVMAEKLSDALRYNPGWVYIGEYTPEYRGRYLVTATTDGGTNPVADYEPSEGVPKRAAHEYWGEETHFTSDPSGDTVYPPSLALWCLVKL